MTKTTLRWSVSACALSIALMSARGANAQSADPPPPINYEVDANSVDVITGALNLAAPQASVGPSGHALTRLYENYRTRDNFYGAINSSGSVYTVSVGSTSETFSQSGNTFTPLQQSGSTLSYDGVSIYTYTMRDGSVAVFNAGYAGPGGSLAGVARIQSLASPTGETLSFAYQNYCSANTQQACQEVGPNAWRLQTVSNNRGLAITYGYQAASGIAGANVGSLTTSNPAACAANSNNCNVGQTTSFGGTTEVDPLSRRSTYPLPAASSTQTITLPSGNTVTVTYDSSSRVISYANGVGTWTYSYSTSGSAQTTTVTDPNGHKKTYASNTALDVITSYTDALGRQTSYSYDNYGRVQTMTRPYGDVVTYTYDGRGNITQTSWAPAPAQGGTPIVTSASYDASCSSAAKCNKPNSTTDGRGGVTYYTYDSTYGVLSTVTKPADVYGVQPTISYSYQNLTAAGQSASIHLLTGISYCNTTGSCNGTADQTVVSIAYDAAHNLAPSSVTTYAGNVTPSAGSGGALVCPTQTGDVTCSTKSFTYDVYGNLATSTNPLGGVTTYFYDADRELTGVVGPDPDGSGPRTPAAARISYTADGLVSESEVGTVNSASPSDFANFSSVLQTLNGYDAADRLVQVANNGGGSSNNFTQYSYDSAGNLQCSAVRMNVSTFGSEPGACTQGTVGVDGPDRITYRTYDNADEPYQVFDGYGASSQRTASTFTYNANGTLGTTVDGKGNQSCYGYDGFKRLTAVDFPTPSNGSTCNQSDHEYYVYDANSNMTYRSYRDGSHLNYSYDADNNLTSDSVWSYGYDTQGRLTGASNSSFSISAAYDALGRKTAEASSNGVMNSSYDAAGDRTQLTWTDGFYVNYDYDLTGTMLDIRENGASSGIGVLASYSFDGLGRISSVLYGSSIGSDGPQYDTAGRLSTWTHGFGGDASKNLVVGLNYNPANQVRTRTYSNSLYEWTMPYNSAQSYGVNGLNQIATAGSSSFAYNGRGSLQSDGSNTYGYDQHNQLTSVSGAANAAMTYDPTQRLVRTTGSATTNFLYDGSMISEELNTSGTVLRRYVPGPNGTPLVWYEGASTSDRRWLYADPLGSVVAVMNSSGTSDGTNTYDAYGVGASSNIGRFQFAGRPWIPEAGLYDNSARSYSPTLGRFLQTDPTRYSDGMNIYAYAHDDPVNGRDPTGLGFWSDISDDLNKFMQSVGAAFASAAQALNGTPEDTTGYTPGGASATPSTNGGQSSDAQKAPEVTVTGQRIPTVTVGPTVSGSAATVNFGGIPTTFISSPSKKGGGTTYIDPNNSNNRVRVMPGNPKSPNPSQQQPYVKETVNGQPIDINGNPVDGNTAEAHMPADGYQFRGEVIPP